MKPQTDNPLDRVPESPKPSVGIWFSLLTPPSVALLHLQLSYVLEHVACSTGSKLQIHIYTIVSLVVVAVAGLVARRHWVELGSDDPGQHPGPVGSLRLMSLFGMIGSGIFTLFILAQWFPNFILPVCIRT
jgi:hypothetical protein